MSDLMLTAEITIPESEIELTAVRAGGAGGQNVNKVSSAVHLRFDIHTSSLPVEIKQRLLKINDQHITKDGLIIIKAQQSRSQLQNRRLALAALQEIIVSALKKRPPRKRTRPGIAAVARRIEGKKLRSRVKALRKKVED